MTGVCHVAWSPSALPVEHLRTPAPHPEWVGWDVATTIKDMGRQAG